MDLEYERTRPSAVPAKNVSEEAAGAIAVMAFCGPYAIQFLENEDYSIGYNSYLDYPGRFASRSIIKHIKVAIH